LQRLAGVKVQHGRKQEGPRYRGPNRSAASVRDYCSGFYTVRNVAFLTGFILIVGVSLAESRHETGVDDLADIAMYPNGTN